MDAKNNSSWIYELKQEPIYINAFLYVDKRIYRREEIFNITSPKYVFSNIENIYANKTSAFLCDLSRISDENIHMLAAKIISSKKCQAVLDIVMAGLSKVYLNGKLEFGSCKRDKREYGKIELLEGENIIIVEYKGVNHEEWFRPTMYIQLYPKEYFKESNDFLSLDFLLEDKSRYYYWFDNLKQFLYVMFIYKGKKTSKNFTVRNKWSNHSYSEKIVLDRPLKFDFSLERDIPLWLELTVDGESDIIYSFIPQEFIDQISSLKHIGFKSDIDRQEILGRLNYFNDPIIYNTSKYNVFHELYHFWKYEKLFVQDSGIYYYFSKIDYSYRYYRLSFPKNYDKRREYPIIICCGVSEYDFLNNEVDLSQNNNYLVLDIAGRGIMGGGFVSLPTYFEVIQMICCEYKVNKNRIFILGKSNGGYATWNILGRIPYIFAGALPISGEPNYRNVENYQLTKILNFISNDDNCYYNNDKIKEFEKQNNYFSYSLNGLLHHSIADYRNYKLLKFFDSVPDLNLFPKFLEFRMIDNRFNQYYWIKLHNISFGHIFAHVKVEIIGLDRIMIDITNSDGICINIPPYVKKEYFEIIINGQRICFNDYTNSTLQLFLDKGQWIHTLDEEIKDELFDYSKGIGIYDVYLDNLTVIIPNNEYKNIIKIAQNFCRPMSQGFYSKINVNYPLKVTNGLELIDRNLVVFSKNIYSEKYLKRAGKVLCFDYGFEYKGKKYEGDYCILQILNNISYPGKVILQVYANNEKKYRENIFSRAVLLPFMNQNTGITNSNVIILFGRTYYYIFENNGELRS